MAKSKPHEDFEPPTDIKPLTEEEQALLMFDHGSLEVPDGES